MFLTVVTWKRAQSCFALIRNISECVSCGRLDRRCVKAVIFMVLKQDLIDEHKGLWEKTENSKSGFLDDTNRVKQKSEPGHSSKKPGKY